MEIEYSNEVRGQVYAYRFNSWKKKDISTGLKFVIAKLEKKIKRIQNNPKNEGQATYSLKIDELRREVKILQENIEKFES
jgi:Zn-dependent oligopeptidase